ncbi:MAG: glucosamine--fructose-6-phosphate aminotransferase [Anaerolineae bacterium]|jgi:glucosamine--fructose-6-phosphate aminotransferase (isomerizing)|nr:MAG: glucosamine--fructose-6-phosphate aminotransferase [Anaerolineae bacterium]
MASQFETEIYEQPDVLSKFLDHRIGDVRTIATFLRKYDPKFVLIAARGTSDNAAIYAKYLFSAFLRVPVGLAIPSLYTLYNQPPQLHQGLVVGISQSGESPDVLAVMEEAKRQQAPTLAIVNQIDSPLVRYADMILPLDCGQEKAVAASKTHTAQLLSIASLVAMWLNDDRLIRDLSPIPEYVAQVLQVHERVREIASQIKCQDRLLIVGRGFTHCTTHEIALKIKELAYISADPYSAADFKHGPIALVEKGFPLVAVAPAGKTFEVMKAIIQEVQQLGADTILITNQFDLAADPSRILPIPTELPEWVSPIVAVVPGQLLALCLTIARGNDPDKPRSLKKVTRTI